MDLISQKIIFFLRKGPLIKCGDEDEVADRTFLAAGILLRAMASSASRECDHLFSEQIALLDQAVISAALAQRRCVLCDS